MTDFRLDAFIFNMHPSETVCKAVNVLFQSVGQTIICIRQAVPGCFNHARMHPDCTAFTIMYYPRVAYRPMVVPVNPPALRVDRKPASTLFFSSFHSPLPTA